MTFVLKLDPYFALLLPSLFQTPLIFFLPLGISPPTNLQFSQVGPTSFTMRWAVPGQENRLTGLTGLTGYRVVVNPKNKSGPTKEINLAPDTTQAHISGLMVCIYDCHFVFVHLKKYQMTVKAFTVMCANKHTNVEPCTLTDITD